MELLYTPTRADVADAVRVQMRHGLFRWLPRALWLVAALTALVAALELFGPGDPEAWPVLRMVGIALVLVVLGPLVRWGTARLMYAMIGRQGEHRALVDEDGVRWTTRDSEVVHRWQLLSRYAETPTQFVLLTADKSGVGVAALPKRGLVDPAGVDRLREVLDRNLTRM
ncbi:YcxB family protein [Streptomyces sp. NPDC058326]|uniref:YcxB family protein n=1 Tax=Streptomyces sp. NPDC058326 TaxID=3346447 RepID=UPI0036E911F1